MDYLNYAAAPLFFVQIIKFKINTVIFFIKVYFELA